MKNDFKKVILCGLGAIGGIYADKFCNTPQVDFYVLADKSRIEKYKKNPVLFNSSPLNPKYITPDYPAIKADLIIISTKYSGYNEALEEIKNFVGEDTVIFPLLNGVTSESAAAEKYGWDKVLYSFFIGHSAIRENNYITHDGIGKIVFGSENKNDPKIYQVKEIFDTAKIDYEIPDDIKYALWQKFILNISSNPTTALFRLTFGEMQNTPPFMDFAQKIMAEVIEIAKAEGIKNTEHLLKSSLDYLKKMSADGKTSMLQDVEAGRKTENEIFAGTVTKLGMKHKIPTPYCNMINEMFEIIDYNK